jgi:hypothetical protein
MADEDVLGDAQVGVTGDVLVDGRSATLDAHQARNVAICLENAVMEASLGMSGTQLFETVPGTASSNIAFLGVEELCAA